ncbi:LmbE-like protein [Calothrix sp. PCC 7716]|nr:LmbE-like protein [Calothrix sp. PCC 7716]
MNKIVPVRVRERLQEIQYSLIQEWIINKGSQPLNLSHNSAMVFAPHQDDETFGCGGMIALKRQQEIPVHVVFITDGQSGVNDLTNKNNTIQVRKQEAAKALEVLGVDNSYTHFLDKRDGALQKLTDEQKQLTIAQIVELLKLYQPQEVYVPYRLDCHPDHEATFDLVMLAIKESQLQVKLLQYPIWVFWDKPFFQVFKAPEVKRAYRLSIASVKDKKSRAIAAYPSQLEFLCSGFIKRFFGNNEIFFPIDI